MPAKNTPLPPDSGSAMGFWFKTAIWIAIIIVGFLYIRHLAKQEGSTAGDAETATAVVGQAPLPAEQAPAPDTADEAMPSPAGAAGEGHPEEAAGDSEASPVAEPVAAVVIEEEAIATPVPETGEVVVEKKVDVTVLDAAPTPEAGTAQDAAAPPMAPADEGAEEVTAPAEQPVAEVAATPGESRPVPAPTATPGESEGVARESAVPSAVTGSAGETEQPVPETAESAPAADQGTRPEILPAPPAASSMPEAQPGNAPQPAEALPATGRRPMTETVQRSRPQAYPDARSRGYGFEPPFNPMSRAFG
ncbi:MAG TPA: hypothetical protein ENK50_02610, partial [Sedimenticola sp.]|nr:hypothetical protein [Sedimenticola sp.]